MSKKRLYENDKENSINLSNQYSPKFNSSSLSPNKLDHNNVQIKKLKTVEIINLDDDDKTEEELISDTESDNDSSDDLQKAIEFSLQSFSPKQTQSPPKQTLTPPKQISPQQKSLNIYRELYFNNKFENNSNNNNNNNNNTINYFNNQILNTTTTKSLNLMNNNDNNYQSEYLSNIFYLNSLPGKFDISIKTLDFEKLFHIKGIESAIVCGFCMDKRWVLELLYKGQGRKVNVTFVLDNKEKYPNQKDDGTIKFVHPPLFPYGCFHSKLILLTYSNFIRVIVPSGNPTEFDYSELGQTIWFQDFYKNTSNTLNTTANNSSQFKETLKTFLKNCTLSNSFLDSFDFSTAKSHLICSTPGYYKMDCDHGLLQIKNILQSNSKLFIQNSLLKSKDIYYQASSIGGNKFNWRNSFKDFLSLNSDTSEKVESSLHILFPTYEWATTNRKRCYNSLCVFFSEKNYNDDKSCFDLLESKYYSRKDTTLHSKILLGTSTTKDNQIRYDFIYVGSHNFSNSAWGTLQKNSTQLYISNYETGIVFINDKSLNDFTPPNWVKNIPFEIPSKRYSQKDEPWIQERLKKPLSQ